MDDPVVLEGYKRLAGAIVLEAVKDALHIGTAGKVKELRPVINRSFKWLDSDEMEFYMTALPMLTPEAVREFVWRSKFVDSNELKEYRNRYKRAVCEVRDR